MIKKICNEYFWIVPFLCFFFTFFISFLFFSQEKRVVPYLLHTSTNKALELLAQEQLNCRLLKKCESTLPPGLVIAQSPQAGKKVKAFQTIFITITITPDKKTTNSVQGLPKEQVMNYISPRTRWCTVYHPGLSHICLTYITSEQEHIAYESSTCNQYVIMPSCTHQPVDVWLNFFSTYNIQPHVIHSRTYNPLHSHSGTILKQHPLPGTVIDISNSPIIEFKI